MYYSDYTCYPSFFTVSDCLKTPSQPNAGSNFYVYVASSANSYANQCGTNVGSTQAASPQFSLPKGLSTGTYQINYVSPGYSNSIIQFGIYHQCGGPSGDIAIPNGSYGNAWWQGQNVPLCSGNYSYYIGNNIINAGGNFWVGFKYLNSNNPGNCYSC